MEDAREEGTTMPDSVAARFTDRNVAKSNVLISKCGSTHVAALLGPRTLAKFGHIAAMSRPVSR